MICTYSTCAQNWRGQNTEN